MTCPRCKRNIPEGRLACECFTAAADREALQLRCVRFLAGQGPMLLRKWNTEDAMTKVVTTHEHVVTKRVKNESVTYCGTKIPDRDAGVVADTWSKPVPCKHCQAAIEQYARQYEQKKAS